MTQHEQFLLLRTTGQRFDGYRDHVLLSLALATGMREHELVALNVSDVLADDGKARRRVQLRVFKSSREDARGEEVVLSSGVQAKLEKFFRWKRRRDESMAADAPLFVSRKGNRLSTRQLRHAFQLWQERAEFERRFSFHSVRHSAITNLYEATRDIRLAQRFARHKSITSTQIYTHPTDEALFRAGAGAAVLMTVSRLQLLQEGEQLVAGPIARGLLLRRCGVGQRLLLQGHVGVDIDLRRLDGLVAQPERNDGAIDTALQERHRPAVPQRMGRDPFCLQSGTLSARAGEMTLQEGLDGAAERPSTRAGKQTGNG